MPVAHARLYLFGFPGSAAVGTIPSVLPFSLVLSQVNLFWTVAFSVPIGPILASARPATLVYAQE